MAKRIEDATPEQLEKRRKNNERQKAKRARDRRVLPGTDGQPATQRAAVADLKAFWDSNYAALPENERKILDERVRLFYVECDVLKLANDVMRGLQGPMDAIDAEFVLVTKAEMENYVANQAPLKIPSKEHKLLFDIVRNLHYTTETILSAVAHDFDFQDLLSNLQYMPPAYQKFGHLIDGEPLGWSDFQWLFAERSRPEHKIETPKPPERSAEEKWKIEQKSRMEGGFYGT